MRTYKNYTQEFSALNTISCDGCEVNIPLLDRMETKFCDLVDGHRHIATITADLCNKCSNNKKIYEKVKTEKIKPYLS